MEIWKDIEGYEGLYQVSNHGKVRSLDYRHTGNKKVLKKRTDKDGYIRVVLYKDGKPKHYMVHRLVAEAFIPNWFDEPQVNHRDENKQNNHVDNLEFCDSKYNVNYGTRTEKCSKRVLQFTKEGEFVKEWSSTAEVGRKGFSHGNISRCCLGKLKSYKGYIWK